MAISRRPKSRQKKYATRAIARKNATRTSAPTTLRATSWLRATTAAAISARIRMFRTKGLMFLIDRRFSRCRHVSPDAQRGGDQRRDREVQESRTRITRGVQPRGEY